jgi:sugar lactone lactonase YvrE
MEEGKFVQLGRFVEGELEEPQVGDYGILFQWSHLTWAFPSEDQKNAFYGAEAHKGCMPAGFKTDSLGNFYLSVPRWHLGIPATLNRVVRVDGKPVLEPYPSWEMNEEGNPDALQSVLGFEIDENDVLWILDQGHVNSEPSVDGSQKIVKWDIKEDKLLEVIKIPDEVSDYTASFLNDICVDNEAGYAYIADSGIFTDPLQGGLIVVNTKTGELRRVLHQHISTQDEPGYWFEIDGTKIWKDQPMRTGADGIALAGDRKTLYWCPLTSRNLYSIDTALLQDFETPLADLEQAVVDLGSKGTNTDGMTADTQGRIWFTMLEGMGIGYYDAADGGMHRFVADERMIWVDTPQLDNQGNILFSTNQLHFLNTGELDYDKPDNLFIWKAFVGKDVKAYHQR